MTCGPRRGRWRSLDAGFVEGLAAEMRASGARALAAEGYPAGRIAFGFSIDLRLRGQEACLSVPFERFDAAALRAAFVAEYRDLYGYAPGDAVEAVLVRLHAQASLAAPLDFAGVRPPARSAPAEGETRRCVHFDGREAVETPVVAREAVRGDARRAADHRGGRHHHRRAARGGGHAGRDRKSGCGDGRMRGLPGPKRRPSCGRSAGPVARSPWRRARGVRGPDRRW